MCRELYTHMKKSVVLLAFDFDNTLFPTCYVEREGWRSFLDPNVDRVLLSMLDSLVKTLLQSARCVHPRTVSDSETHAGHHFDGNTSPTHSLADTVYTATYIVTNAGLAHIKETMKLFLPETHAYVDDWGWENVVSARDTCGDTCEFSEWKCATFLNLLYDCVSALDTSGDVQIDAQVISIGDGEWERSAAFWLQKAAPQIVRSVKSLQFLPNSSLFAIIQQLNYVIERLHLWIGVESSIDCCFQFVPSLTRGYDDAQKSPSSSASLETVDTEAQFLLFLESDTCAACGLPSVNWLPNREGNRQIDSQQSSTMELGAVAVSRRVIPPSEIELYDCGSRLVDRFMFCMRVLLFEKYRIHSHSKGYIPPVQLFNARQRFSWPCAKNSHTNWSAPIQERDVCEYVRYAYAQLVTVVRQRQGLTCTLQCILIALMTHIGRNIQTCSCMDENSLPSLIEMGRKIWPCQSMWQKEDEISLFSDIQSLKNAKKNSKNTKISHNYNDKNHAPLIESFNKDASDPHHGTNQKIIDIDDRQIKEKNDARKTQLGQPTLHKCDTDVDIENAEAFVSHILSIWHFLYGWRNFMSDVPHQTFAMLCYGSWETLISLSPNGAELARQALDIQIDNEKQQDFVAGTKIVDNKRMQQRMKNNSVKRTLYATSARKRTVSL